MTNKRNFIQRTDSQPDRHRKLELQDSPSSCNHSAFWFYIEKWSRLSRVD